MVLQMAMKKKNTYNPFSFCFIIIIMISPWCYLSCLLVMLTMGMHWAREKQNLDSLYCEDRWNAQEGSPLLQQDGIFIEVSLSRENEVGAAAILVWAWYNNNKEILFLALSLVCRRREK